jgi:hypothetical protein
MDYTVIFIPLAQHQTSFPARKADAYDTISSTLAAVNKAGDFIMCLLPRAKYADNS